jgi:hypothetical protein
MSNTLNTLSGELIVQETLETLLADFPAIKQISTDFTGGAAKLNQEVNSRVVVPRVAAIFDPAVGYVATDATTIDVPVTINLLAHATFAVTDIEQSKTDRKLRDELVKTNAHALGSRIMIDLFAAVTAATYPLSFPISPANFDAARLRKVRTLLNKAKVPDLGRFCVLNCDYAEGLGLDNIVIANPNTSNQGVISTGKLPRLHNFECSEYSDLPDNGEGLGGIAGNKEAIVMAGRTPAVPVVGPVIPGLIQNVTEPNTSLTVQLRQYYDMKLGTYVETLTLMYGFAQGLSEAGLSRRLVRITA